MAKAELTYCGELVRQHDRDRFWLSLLMPPGKRPALWALYAFNHEIAKTREIVSETTLGLIRLQWWREGIEEIYQDGSVREHEILGALKEAVGRYDLPQEYFETLLYAREFDLEDVLPSSLEGMQKYVDFTNTPLFALSLRVLGEKAPDEDIAAIAQAYGLTGLLRSVPFLARQRRCYLPSDLLAKNEVSLAHLYNMKPGEGLPAVAKDVAHLAENLLKSQSRGSRFLERARHMTRLYLKQIRHLEYDLFDARIAQPPPFFHLRLAAGF